MKQYQKQYKQITANFWREKKKKKRGEERKKQGEGKEIWEEGSEQLCDTKNYESKTFNVLHTENES